MDKKLIALYGPTHFGYLDSIGTWRLDEDAILAVSPASHPSIKLGKHSIILKPMVLSWVFLPIPTLKAVMPL